MGRAPNKTSLESWDLGMVSMYHGRIVLRGKEILPALGTLWLATQRMWPAEDSEGLWGAGAKPRPARREKKLGSKVSLDCIMHRPGCPES